MLQVPNRDPKEDTSVHIPWKVTDAGQEAAVPSSLLLPLTLLFRLFHGGSGAHAAQ